MIRSVLTALALAGVLAGATSARAEPSKTLTPEQLREASAILDDTWSPFCPGRTLSSCTSGKAAEWREDVRSWLAAGLTRDEILVRLQARVPGFTLETVPETGGMRYGPWILGGVFLLVLGALAYVHARRSSTASPAPEPVWASPNPAADRKRLHAELEALED